MDIGKPYIVVSLFSALLLSALALADITPVPPPATTPAPVDAAAAPQLDPQDRSFADLFINAGLAEQELGQLAEQRSRHASVRKLAQTLSADHKASRSRLEAMLAPMRLAPLPAQPDAEHMALAHQLQQAEQRDFDRLYVDDRVRDHEDLISILEMEISSGTRQELKQFASEALTVERQHLQEARRMARELKTAH